MAIDFNRAGKVRSGVFLRTGKYVGELNTIGGFLQRESEP
jgi:hypothetical protein